MSKRLGYLRDRLRYELATHLSLDDYLIGLGLLFLGYWWRLFAGMAFGWFLGQVLPWRIWTLFRKPPEPRTFQVPPEVRLILKDTNPPDGVA